MVIIHPTPIKRIIIIPLENKSHSTWIKDPYIGKLANTYGDATNFHGFSGTSLPDYLMETSGSNQGVTGDSFTFCQFKVNNIYDVLTANGLTFENFEEKTGSQGNHRHTPGYLYPSTCKGVQNSATFLSKYVNGTQIPTPYTWVTPNFCNCGHDCPVTTVSNWLQNTLKLNTILSKPWFMDGSTLVILVCDDGGSAATPTLCLMMSTSSKGTKSNVSYKHTNDLSTVMWLLGITGSIGNSTAGAAMKDLFGSTPPPTEKIVVTNPTAGLTWKIGTGHVIRWTHAVDSGSLVKIELLKTNKVINTLSNSTANDNQFAWTVPNIVAGTDYQIKITSLSNGSIFGISGNFTIN